LLPPVSNDCEECVVELHHLGPVGLTCAAAMHVRGLQRGFDLIAADGAQGAGLVQRDFGFVDHLRVPERGILSASGM